MLCSGHRRWLCVLAHLSDVQQALVVPLVRSEKNAGYLVAGVAAGYALPQQDIELLQTIATEMALMIENADLRKKTELQAHRLDQARSEERRVGKSVAVEGSR